MALSLNASCFSPTSERAGHLSESDRAARCPTGKKPAAGSRILAQQPQARRRFCRLTSRPASSSLMVVGTLPKKRAVCINYGIVPGREKQHAANMESTFPAIFFAAIIGVIVFIAVSQVLLDSHE